MIPVPAAECRRHRDVLIDFIDRRERGPATAAALDHLDTCHACERELEATAMAIIVLRRLVNEAEPLEPAPDAWTRLRARVDRPRVALWRWRTTLAGVALSAGLVATLVAPRAIWHQATRLSQDGEAGGYAGDVSSAIEWSRAFERHNLPIPAPAAEDPLEPPAVGYWTGPDGHRITFEAESTTPPTGRLN